MLPNVPVEEVLLSLESDRRKCQSGPRKEDDTMSYKHDGAQRWVHSEGLYSDRTAADYYRYDTLFPTRIFGTNYGRTIRMLLAPQRACLQKYQDFSLVQKPIVVMMMTRGRTLHVDQSDVVNNGSMQQQMGPSSQKEARSDFRKNAPKVSMPVRFG